MNGESQSSSLVQGTLHMLILKTLTLEPLHGYGIGVRLEQISDGGFRVNAGSLFPALSRLERDGLITGEWRVTENNRRAKYYHLTPRAGPNSNARPVNGKRRPPPSPGFSRQHRDSVMAAVQPLHWRGASALWRRRAEQDLDDEVAATWTPPSRRRCAPADTRRCPSSGARGAGQHRRGEGADPRRRLGDALRTGSGATSVMRHARCVSRRRFPGGRARR